MSCPDCFKGAIHDHAEPTGHFETIHGCETYVTGDADAKSAILFLPDAFGLKLVNNKLLADRYAAGTGCKVLIPDLLWRGGADPSSMDAVETLLTPSNSFLSRLWAFFVVAPTLIPFMIFGAAPKAYPDVLKYARAVRAALPPGGKLGVAGFCWGGYGSTNLCKEKVTEEESKDDRPLIDAQFNGHPSRLKTPDMVVDAIAAKVPYSCAVAELDMSFSKDVAHEVEAAVRAKVGPPEENNYEFVVYKGTHPPLSLLHNLITFVTLIANQDCIHGFCVRANPGTPNMDGYHGSAKQAIEWFNKYLR